MEIEKEVKYTVNQKWLENMYFNNTFNQHLNLLNIHSYGKHLIVYYDFGTELYGRGDTFRLTYRKDRNRGTYKVNKGKEGCMRICEEHHFPFTKNVNPHKKYVTELDGLPDTGFPFLERVCWVLVHRVKGTLLNVPVEIDTCHIMVGSERVRYMEIEIEDIVPTEEWVNELKKFGSVEESKKNKYQTVYDLVYGR